MAKREKSGLKPIVNEKLKYEALIVAKNRVQAKLWAREHSLKASQWTYAAHPERLAGVDERHEVVFVPGWEDRDDSRWFADMVANAGCKVIAA